MRRNTQPAARSLLATIAVASACARPAVRTDAGAGEVLPTVRVAHRPVRVQLVAGARSVTVSATGGWQLLDRGGESTLLRAGPRDTWTVATEGALMRARSADGEASAARPGPWVVRPGSDGAMVTVNGKRYRGVVTLYASGGAIAAVNRLPVEDYLRGVVPLELGTRAAADREALAAQAVAARSYAYSHLADDEAGTFDVRASVLDQVYGGASAETDAADAGVRETAGLVLSYAGRVVNAPYHAVCGGATAAASEVWQGSGDEPYLRSVSDRIPGSDRYYCDVATTFRWERSYDAEGLRAVLDRYLRTYAAVPSGGVGRVRDVEIEGRTESGRVRALGVETDAGRFTLRGNEIRYVLRSPGGEILNSTYFSVASDRGADGAVARLVLRGGGNGHGIGMCQWGAIGRARAGQDFRTILRTYYPGTTLATVE